MSTAPFLVGQVVIEALAFLDRGQFANTENQAKSVAEQPNQSIHTITIDALGLQRGGYDPATPGRNRFFQDFFDKAEVV